MKKDIILEIMVAQHALLEALFASFKGEPAGSQQKQNFFAELTLEAKKHFLIEEQAIFALLPWKGGEILEMVNKLKREHILMTAKLEGAAIDEEFSKTMESHLEVEEKKLYPLLDKKLNDEEKKLIISRINEIPFGPK